MGAGCESCDGKGEIILKRCFNFFDVLNVMPLFQAFAFFNNHKILPNAGGFCDQSNNFHKVINLASKVESLIEAEKQKKKKVMMWQE
jgi:hypothetical protein